MRADADHWRPWAAAVVVDSSGSHWLPADLPCPRQYLQFRIAFAGDPTRAIQVDELAVEYSSPLADRAVGELALAADPAPPGGVVLVPAGVETTFVHDIRAEFDAASREGFRGVRLVSFPPPEFVRLEMGTPLAAVDPDSVVAAADGFTV